MKFLLTILLLFSFDSLSAQTRLFVDPNFSSLANDHQTIAVLPFKTIIKLRPKQMKNLNDGDMERMQLEEGKGIQTAMYAWFLKRRQTGKMWVDIQDVATTNATLLKNDIDETTIERYTPQELAKILGVDAVVSGTFETSKPMSDGAGVALALLVGFYGSTNNAVINMFVHDSETGKALVNYNKAISGSIGSNSDQLINIIMRKASRRIPYTKPKI
jgi:hypothetical protein